MEKIFQIAAVILIAIAAIFLWKGNNDWMFVAAVAGAVCFFLSIRFQVGERVKQREREAQELTVRAENDSNADVSDY